MSPSPQRLTDRKRAAVIQAAVAQFRAAGYEATSMDRIAAAAGVSKRTVYNHFPSKQALFDAMLEQLWQRSQDSGERRYQAGHPLAGQLHQLLLAKLQVLSDPSFLDLARVALTEVLHAPERAQDIVRRMESVESGLTAWIRAAKEDGRLDLEDAEFVAQQLHGIVKNFAFWPQISLGRPPLEAIQRERVAASTVAMFMACYARS